MVRIKICQVTTLEDARFCAGAGAHYLGFVQDFGDAAYVPPAQAREIIEWLHGVEPVGVFRSGEPEQIESICEEAGFTHAQLEHHLTPDAVGAIDVPTIKSFDVHHDASLEQLTALMDDYRNAADFFLLDTARTSLWGGEGESFSWRVARALAQRYPLFLGGDVTAANLQDTVDTMQPFALDVGASVEVARGAKDLDKVAALLEANRAGGSA